MRPSIRFLTMFGSGANRPVSWLMTCVWRSWLRMHVNKRRREKNNYMSATTKKSTQTHLCDKPIVLHDFTRFHGAHNACFDHGFPVLVNFSDCDLMCVY